MNGLQKALDCARLVKYDWVRRYSLAWFGGHNIHVYTSTGREVSCWSIDSETELTLDEVHLNMIRHMNDNDYPY
jgi:hypothetical protein